MARVIWTETALNDLQRHTEFIRKDSPKNAADINRRIRAAVKILNEFPELGSIVPEFGISTIRERFVFSYRIIYEVRDQECQVLFIFHGSQDLNRYFDLSDEDQEMEKY
jgi:toxin ParE1/3/4